MRMRVTVSLNLNSGDVACMVIIKLKCAPTSASEVKCQNWRCIQGLRVSRGSRINRDSLIRMIMWGSQENTIGPKQYKQNYWLSIWRDEVPCEAGSDPEWERDRFRMSVRATWVPFPTSFKPSQKGSCHTMTGCEENAPKLLPLLNQESVSTSLHLRWSEPPAISPEGLEGFWKSAQDKDRLPVLNNGTATQLPLEIKKPLWTDLFIYLFIYLFFLWNIWQKSPDWKNQGH